MDTVAFGERLAGRQESGRLQDVLRRDHVRYVTTVATLAIVLALWWANLASAQSARPGQPFIDQQIGPSRATLPTRTSASRRLHQT